MSVTLSGITYDLDQADWGSTRLYDDLSLDGLWVPDKVVVHWGGRTIPPSTTRGINRLFQGWQRFHLGKGWQDIAYGAGVGNDGLTRRLRGWNHQGATSGDFENDGIPENSEAFACVWAGGSGGAISPKAYAAMASLVQNVLDVIENPVEVVIGHRDVKGNTVCPGDEWWQWVQDKGWFIPSMEDDMILQEGDKAFAVVKYKKALNAWAAATGANFPPLQLGSTFDSAMGDFVEAYHRASQLDDVQWMLAHPDAIRQIHGITADLLNEYNPDVGSGGGGDLSRGDTVKLI